MQLPLTKALFGNLEKPERRIRTRRGRFWLQHVPQHIPEDAFDGAVGTVNRKQTPQFILRAMTTITTIIEQPLRNNTVAPTARQSFSSEMFPSQDLVGRLCVTPCKVCPYTTYVQNQEFNVQREPPRRLTKSSTARLSTVFTFRTLDSSAHYLSNRKRCSPRRRR